MDKHLYLHALNINDETIVYFIDYFSENLEILTLSNNNISDKGLKCLVNNFWRLPNLKSLDLSRNQFTDKSVEYFAEGLLNLPNLKSLLVNHNTFSDEAIEYTLNYFSRLENSENLYASVYENGDYKQRSFGKSAIHKFRLEYRKSQVGNLTKPCKRTK